MAGTFVRINIPGSGTGSGGGSSVASGISSFTASFVDVTSVPLNHGLNTEDLLWHVYDTNNNVLFPEDFAVVDANNATLTFTFPQTGRIVIGGLA